MILARGLIVACAAAPDDPAHGPFLAAAMARAAVAGGAVAIQAETPAALRAIRAAIAHPLIGLIRPRPQGDGQTPAPDFAAARAAAAAGADVIALRAAGPGLPSLLRRIGLELCLPVMAEVASVEEGRQAVDLGADYLLAGSPEAAPDVALVAGLVRRLPVPVVAAGAFQQPDQLRPVLEAGAAAVVVGPAVIDPRAIAGRFAAAFHG